MKRIIMSLSFVLVIIVGLCLFTGCGKKDIASKEDRKNVPLMLVNGYMMILILTLLMKMVPELMK